MRPVKFFSVSRILSLFFKSMWRRRHYYIIVIPQKHFLNDKQKKNTSEVFVAFLKFRICETVQMSVCVTQFSISRSGTSINHPGKLENVIGSHETGQSLDKCLTFRQLCPPSSWRIWCRGVLQSCIPSGGSVRVWLVSPFYYCFNIIITSVPQLEDFYFGQETIPSVDKLRHSHCLRLYGFSALVILLHGPEYLFPGNTSFVRRSQQQQILWIALIT